jgi:hypothetical protein
VSYPRPDVSGKRIQTNASAPNLYDRSNTISKMMCSANSVDETEVPSALPFSGDFTAGGVKSTLDFARYRTSLTAFRGISPSVVADVEHLLTTSTYAHREDSRDPSVLL